MTDKAISPLRRRMIEDMTIRKFAPKTQASYIRAVRNFTIFLGRSPDQTSAEDLRRYQLHLASSGVSVPSQNATVTTLRFFFAVTLGRSKVTNRMPFVREPRTLPVVLSPEEVVRFLEAAPGLKYRAALSVAYGAGLRANEVVSLKVGDIPRVKPHRRFEFRVFTLDPPQRTIPSAGGLLPEGEPPRPPRSPHPAAPLGRGFIIPIRRTARRGGAEGAGLILSLRRACCPWPQHLRWTWGSSLIFDMVPC